MARLCLGKPASAYLCRLCFGLELKQIIFHFFVPGDFKFLLDISWAVNIFIHCSCVWEQWGRSEVDFCPFWSGGQVWADNCRACAAETDDYRVYCLSQAQSTLPHVPDSAHSLPLDLWGSEALSPSLRLHHGHYIAWILSLICFLPCFHCMCVLYFLSLTSSMFLYVVFCMLYVVFSHYSGAYVHTSLMDTGSCKLVFNLSPDFFNYVNFR